MPPTAVPLAAARRQPAYRELLAIIAMQAFGNLLAVGFWIVYLIGEPALPFSFAVLVWLLVFLVASMVVLVIARRGAIPVRSTVLFGIGCASLAQTGFALLPPIYAMMLAGVAAGIYLPSFWLPMNLLLVRRTTQTNRAARLAAITTTFTAAAVVAPALGGLIAQVFGYRALFAVSAIVIAINILFALTLLRRDESVTFSLSLRRVGTRMSVAFGGQGAVDGLWIAAVPISTFLFTQAALELGLLFALFSLAAGATALALGLFSDRAKVRWPFLILGPVLSIPGCVVAFVSRDLVTFAFAVGWLSMTTSIAPSFLFTIAADRMEDAVATLSSTRELLLNLLRSATLVASLALLAAGVQVYVLFLVMAGAILLEAAGR